MRNHSSLQNQTLSYLRDISLVDVTYSDLFITAHFDLLLAKSKLRSVSSFSLLLSLKQLKSNGTPAGSVKPLLRHVTKKNSYRGNNPVISDNRVVHNHEYKFRKYVYVTI